MTILVVDNDTKRLKVLAGQDERNAREPLKHGGIDGILVRPVTAGMLLESVGKSKGRFPGKIGKVKGST